MTDRPRVSDRRVALYVRAARPTDLAAQHERLAAFAAARGWEITTGFEDIGSTVHPRPGLEGALLAAEAGAFDVLLVEDAARLDRRMLGFFESLDRLEAAGVSLVLTDEPLPLTGPYARPPRATGAASAWDAGSYRVRRLLRFVESLNRLEAAGVSFVFDPWTGQYAPTLLAAGATSEREARSKRARRAHAARARSNSTTEGKEEA